MSITNDKKHDIEAKEEKVVFRSSSPVEAGDLTNEIGKKCYMKGLWECIHDHQKYKRTILWFVVHTKKDIVDRNTTKITIAAVGKPLKLYHQNVDLWRYNYLSEELDLLWSLPHRTDMMNFLRSPEKYDKKLIRWINAYIKQDNINLDDKNKIILK